MDRTEKVELTVLCMIYKDNKLLLQERRKEDWQGLTFPGGHVEKEESFVQAVIREMKEETGLDIELPKLCGVKQFHTDSKIRYIVLLFKTDQFSGELISSDEGKMLWIDRSDLPKLNTVADFAELLEVFDSDRYQEFMYERNPEQEEMDWRILRY